MSIHERAIVHPGAKVGRFVEVGPYAIIEEGVEIGDRVKVWPHAYICTGTTIGEDSQIHMGAVVGHTPQDLAFEGKPTYTKIGKRTVIREYATIHRGTKEGSATSIGDDCYIMAVGHVAHNCQLGDRVIVANGALLAGYIEVGDGAFISGNVVIHQFCRIGTLSMIGGFTGVNKDVPPYMLVRGPSTVRYLNLVGLRRAKVSREAIAGIKSALKLLYMSGMNTAQALDEMVKLPKSKELDHLIDFIKKSKRGICDYKSGTEEFFE